MDQALEQYQVYCQRGSYMAQASPYPGGDRVVEGKRQAVSGDYLQAGGNGRYFNEQ